MRPGRDQPAFVGVDDRLHAVSDAELPQAPGDVGLRGRLADGGLPADPGVREAAPEQVQHLALTRGQLRDRRGRLGRSGGGRQPHELFDHRPGDGRREQRVAAGDDPRRMLDRVRDHVAKQGFLVLDREPPGPERRGQPATARLAAGVAQELGNPVPGIACLAQNVLTGASAPEFVRDSIEQMLEQTRRISNIVHSLVSFSHSGTAVDQPLSTFNVRQCVDDAMRLVRLSHAGKQIEFFNQCPPEAAIRGERQRMIQVFVNLLSNACDASHPGDRIQVSGRTDGDFIEVVVRDYGDGIPEELQDHVFEPFFTTKQPGEGTGLGLPMVYNIVAEHAGTVALRSREGEGTSVILRVPAVAVPRIEAGG